MKKERNMKKNHTWFIIYIIFSIFVILISACEANTSTSSVAGDDVLPSADAFVEVKNIISNTTDRSIILKWTAPTLSASHKKKDGTSLTKADISYKVYRVEKGAKSRIIANIMALDKSPIQVKKGIITTNINNLKPTTTYEVVVQAVNSTDPTKASTGIKIEVTTLATNHATAPAEASNVTGNPTDISASISWQAPTLNTSHKKKDGTALTKAEVSYKVYRVAKGSDARTVAEIKEADTNPQEVAKGTTSITINSLTPTATYEVVVQAVNSTDTTKVSTGIKIEVTTLATNQATAPADASNVRGSSSDDSVEVSWQAPTLDTSHKKANGETLTTADVSYKVYRVAKGDSPRTIAEIKTADSSPLEVTKNTTSKTITNLTGSTTYEIVIVAVNSTDTTKVSTGVRAEVTTTNPANAPAEVSSVTAGSTTASSTTLSWTAPTLDTSHKKADGGRLTSADISYKVYRVAKGDSPRTIAEIKTADSNPLEVAKNTTRKTIINLTGSTTYEIVIVAVNSTDTTKVSIGVKKEVTTSNPANAPTEVSNITASNTTASSTTLSWTAPALTNNHKKANGKRLTTADVSYKVYRVAKGSDERTIAQIKTADPTPLAVAKGTTRTTITKLNYNTAYEIVIVAVNSTDTTKESTGVKKEVTTNYIPNIATAPTDVSNITAGSTTASSTTLSWTAPTLDNSHKKADGGRLTSADVSYKVYRVAKGDSPRTIAQIKSADTSPLEVAKNTTRKTITNLTGSTTYEIVIVAVNSTDTTKVSTGIRKEVTTVNPANAPTEVSTIVAGSTTDSSTTLSWTAPALTNNHKKANGQRLTTADVSYKVYRVAKGSDERTVAQIKTADTTPLEVAKNTTRKTITNLTGSTTYEIVIVAVNSTDTTKVSTGVRAEVTTTNPANAPAEVSNIVAGSTTASSTTLSWTAPALTTSHKKADGGRLTSADVSYKVYRVAKGSDERTIAQIKSADTTPLEVAKNTTRKTISSLTGSTTYEIVIVAVNSTDTTKVSTGVKKEVTTTNPANAPTEVSNITAGSTTASSTTLSWTAPALTTSHKKADGGRLTTADVSYKVYRVAKGDSPRTIAEIKTADSSPLEVAKNTTSKTITNLTGSTTYEIVIVAVNSTDTTKVSTGVKKEVTTTNPANAPTEVSNITAGSTTDSSTTLSWTAPALTNNHKKADGGRLTTADVSYKVYWVAKGDSPRTIAEIKTADTTPLAVAKNTTSKTISNLTGSTTYEIVVQAVNSTDATKVSTGIRIEVTTTNHANAPAEVSNIVAGSTTASSTTLSWTAPTLDTSHKKADGGRLTSADVSYKVYRLAKGDSPRTIAQIKSADTTPLAVAKNTTRKTISNLTGSTTYEIVIVAVNSTDTTKVSTGIRKEVTTLSSANAPAEARSVTAGSTTASSTTISWTAPNLTSSHKQANGQNLTSADVSYKVYRVAKGSDDRTVAQIKSVDTTPLAVAKGTTSKSISNLTGSTTYEIVVQSVNATDTTKVSTGIRIEVTTSNPANAPANPRSVTAGSPTDDSVRVSWQAPTLDTSYKKANGQRLTTADVSYKVYRVAKGDNARSVAQIKSADTTPLEVAKNTTRKTISNLTGSTTYEIVIAAVNSTDTTKISTGIRIEITTTNPANAPAEVSNIVSSTIVERNPYNIGTTLIWTAPTLDTSHKKANGQNLTSADVSYKVYRVAKGDRPRTVAQIKLADTRPLLVAKSTTRVTMHNVMLYGTYEIVVVAVNSTDTKKVSTGIRKELTVESNATAPPDARRVISFTGHPSNKAVTISWITSTPTNSHKIPDGTKLAKTDIGYYVYYLEKKGSPKTVQQIKEGDPTPKIVFNATQVVISNLKPSTTYEVVVQAVNQTDTTKVSTGIRIEATTLVTLNNLVFKVNGEETVYQWIDYPETANIIVEQTPFTRGTYSISPNLTADTGLSFDTKTGRIYGQPTKTIKGFQARKQYTVTFTGNDGRTAQGKILLKVRR